jgi:hypothetical protein
LSSELLAANLLRLKRTAPLHLSQAPVETALLVLVRTCLHLGLMPIETIGLLTLETA